MEKILENGHSQEKFYPLMCDYIPEEYRLKAKETLNETPKNIEEGVKALRKIIERDNLNLRTDEHFLLLYLRQSKFNLKKAEAKLKKSLKFYSDLEDLVENTTFERIRAVVETDSFGVLPYRERDGKTVFFARAFSFARNKDLFDMNDVGAAIGCLSMYISKSPLTSVTGYSYLADAKVDHLPEYIPLFGAYRRYVPYLNVCPFRVTRADLVNCNYLCRCFYSAIRPIIPAKIRNRVFLYGFEFEKLREIYPKSMLPQELLGGEVDTLISQSFKDKFYEFLGNYQSSYRPNNK